MIRRYPGLASKGDQAVYAVPTPLIDLIVRRLPGFFTELEENFERELSEKAGSGFFQGQPFWYAPVGTSAPSRAESSLDVKVKRDNEKVLAMLEDEMRNNGVSSAQIEQDRLAAAREQEVITQWSWGYAGWLATNGEFRRQCRSMKALLGARLGEAGLPRIPRTLHGQGTSVEDHIEFTKWWGPFYCSWGIEALTTWELPMPLRAELNAPCMYNLSSLSGAGVNLFIPWYLLRHRSFDINALAEQRQRQTMPKSLNDWLNSSDGSWGPSRYLTMLRLYVYWELAIGDRYNEKRRGKAAAFDRIFAEFFSLRDSAAIEEDSIKKIRLRLALRLRS